jgi:hypothetical protein
LKGKPWAFVLSCGWRRPIVAIAFGICVAATMVLAAEKKFYEDTLEAFDRVQIGMTWNEADWVLRDVLRGSRSEHPERYMANHRMEERVDATRLDVYRVGDYRLEIVFKTWDGTVLEKRRTPEPWMSLVMLRRLLQAPIRKISSYLPYLQAN